MRTPTKTRHRDLSELSALLQFRSRPTGVAEGVEVADDEKPSMQTNWRLTPANDNEMPGDGFGVERTVEIEPSVSKIMAAVAGIEMRHHLEPRRQWGCDLIDDARHMRKTCAIPVAGDIEYGVHIDDAGRQHKVIARIGSLRFSDGTNTEVGDKRTIDGKVVKARFRLPVGAMIGTREKSARDKGSAQDPAEISASNRFFAGGGNAPGLFTAQPPARRVRKAERKRAAKPMAKAEARALLAEQMAKTDVVITKFPTGWPAGPKNLAQLFPGLVKAPKGESGFVAWQETFSGRTEKSVWEETLQTMKDDDIDLLTKAMEAKSLGQIGRARGYAGKYAIEAGRRLLVAANDNFQAAMMMAREAT